MIGLMSFAGILQAQKQPNVLYIMADDHAATAIGAYNSRLAQYNPTPAIDQLAKEGVRLNQVFCTNSICVPSRGTILTGQYNKTSGCKVNASSLPAKKQYLAIEMKKAGYHTAVIGKWHLKEEPAAFDYYKILPGQGDYINPEFREFGKGAFPENIVQHEGHSSDVIGDIGVEWLSNHDKNKPFFLSLHFKAPHGPWKNAKRFDSYLADVEVEYPDNLFDKGNQGSIATRGHNDELVNYIGTSIGRRNHLRNATRGMDKTNADALSDEELKRKSYQLYIKQYLRCVRGVDENVQKVISYLKENNLYDNTVIVYTGDQGMWLGEHDYIDKRWMYEESMRMPLIIRYPKGIKAGTQCETLINNTDFAPTILDFAGVENPEYMHGSSFKSIVETGEEPKGWRKATYYRYWLHMKAHYNPAHFGIRTKQYKLIFFYGCNEKGNYLTTPPGWEFYDLKEDPFEMNNLYGEEKYAEVIEDLKEQLKEIRKKYNETDEDNPVIQAVIEKHWNTTDESIAEAIAISHKAKAELSALAQTNKNKPKKKHKKKNKAD
ncbi:sulfatase [Labilibacter sediminis]|nr:sulfatase [Labilibacter sediminis]